MAIFRTNMSQDPRLVSSTTYISGPAGGQRTNARFGSVYWAKDATSSFFYFPGASGSLAGNVPYTASIWIRNTDPTTPLSGAIRIGTQTTSDQAPYTPLPTSGEWVRLSHTRTPTTTATQSFRVQFNRTGADFEAAAVLIEASAEVGTYFDGYSPNAFWLGTPDASTSQWDQGALAMTARASADFGTVLLEIDAGPAAALHTLTRTDANGTRPVRLYSGQNLSDGSLTVTDSEAALVGPVTHTATTRIGTDYTDATATVTFDGLDVKPRLAPAVSPNRGVEVDAILTYDSQRVSTSIEHTVIGRDMPLVSLGVPGSRRGRMSIWCSDYMSARTVEASLGTGEIVFMRQPDFPGMDMYFTATSTSLHPFDDNTRVRRWELSVDYLETAAPTGNLFGSLGWTVGASLARSATLLESSFEFGTIGDLTRGPVENV